MLHMIGLRRSSATTAFDMSQRTARVQTVDPAEESLCSRPQRRAEPQLRSAHGEHPSAGYLRRALDSSIDSEHDVAVLENDMRFFTMRRDNRVLQADYELVVIRKGAAGWFSREDRLQPHDLQPHRQYIYDEQGKPGDRCGYANYKDYDGVSFPSRLELFRPHEEYDITLNMLKARNQ